MSRHQRLVQVDRTLNCRQRLGRAFRRYQLGGNPLDDLYQTDTGELADMVHLALDADSLRPWPLADSSIPWELVGALNEATLQWLSAGPAVLESVLAGVESAWQSFEAETGG